MQPIHADAIDRDALGAPARRMLQLVESDDPAQRREQVLLGQAAAWGDEWQEIQESFGGILARMRTERQSPLQRLLERVIPAGIDHDRRHILPVRLTHTRRRVERLLDRACERGLLSAMDGDLFRGDIEGESHRILARCARCSDWGLKLRLRRARRVLIMLAADEERKEGAP